MPLLTLGRPLRISIKAPCRTLDRDAVPGLALFNRVHAQPPLYFFKRATTAFAHLVPLAGGADGDARCVGRAVVPRQPSRVSRFAHHGHIHLQRMVVHHAGIDLCQRTGRCG